MSAGQLRETVVNETPQDLLNREPALISLYCELTGENEIEARSTFMYVLRDDAASQPSTQ